MATSTSSPAGRRFLTLGDLIRRGNMPKVATAQQAKSLTDLPSLHQQEKGIAWMNYYLANDQFEAFIVLDSERLAELATNDHDWPPQFELAEAQAFQDAPPRSPTGYRIRVKAEPDIDEAGDFQPDVDAAVNYTPSSSDIEEVYVAPMGAIAFARYFVDDPDIEVVPSKMIVPLTIHPSVVSADGRSSAKTTAKSGVAPPATGPGILAEKVPRLAPSSSSANATMSGSDAPLTTGLPKGRVVAAAGSLVKKMAKVAGRITNGGFKRPASRDPSPTSDYIPDSNSEVSSDDGPNDPRNNKGKGRAPRSPSPELISALELAKMAKEREAQRRETAAAKAAEKKAEDRVDSWIKYAHGSDRPIGADIGNVAAIGSYAEGDGSFHWRFLTTVLGSPFDSSHGAAWARVQRLDAQYQVALRGIYRDAKERKEHVGWLKARLDTDVSPDALGRPIGRFCFVEGDSKVKKFCMGYPVALTLPNNRTTPNNHRQIIVCSNAGLRDLARGKTRPEVTGHRYVDAWPHIKVHRLALPSGDGRLATEDHFKKENAMRKRARLE